MSVEIGFENQVVLVTGGATGLGFATATVFGKAGARIALNDLDGDRASHACQQLAADGISARPFPADIRDAIGIQRMIGEIEQSMGPTDVLVANAGVYPVSSFLEMAERTAAEFG